MSSAIAIAPESVRRPSVAADSLTMIRRRFLHTWRNPETLFGGIIFPVIMLAMFVYFFGGAMDVGTEYINYVMPGIVLLAAGYGVGVTAVTVSTDMADGIIARFRTMAISRSSVLVGHVVGSVAPALLGIGLVIGVTFLMGFRSDANVLEWLAAVGLIVALVTSITLLAIALAVSAPNPQTANFYAFPLVLLPFVSTAFAPSDTMSGGVRWFVDNQPFSQVIETLRALLTGTELGNHGWWAAGWMAAFAIGGFLWARALLNREPTR